MILTTFRVANGNSTAQIDAAPGVCPVCHNAIVAVDMNVNFNFGTTGERVYQCPNTNCQVLFIAKYARYPKAANTFELKSCVPFELLTTSHSETIKAISADFCEIYAQAEKAEQYGLILIAGPGYRKALEFLMKDYACLLQPDQKEGIEKMLLGLCISTYIKSDQIKAIAKRAAWLGNDETHYVRKWADKDLNDLKKLISLTLHWIEAEKLSQDIIKDMPEGGPAAATSA